MLTAIATGLAELTMPMPPPPLRTGRWHCLHWERSETCGNGTRETAAPLATDPPATQRPVDADRMQELRWTALIRRVAQNDEAALGTFYDATSPLVYGVALRILRDVATAEEVTADVYMQVWRRASTYAAERGTPSAWLLMMTRSRAIDRLRAGAQTLRRNEPLQEAAPIATGLPNPEEESVLAERRRLVHKAFEELSRAQREAIELAFFSGLTHSQIAARYSHSAP
jgi:RNA polymerase sigma-70 factor (ECF subfamily)